MKEEMRVLFEAVRNKDKNLITIWKNTEMWNTLQQLIAAAETER